MFWGRVDRFLILLSGSTLAAVLIVGWLTPYRRGENRGCGMDAPFHLASLRLPYLCGRAMGWALQAFKACIDTVAACFAADEPYPILDPEFSVPTKHDPS